MLTFEVTIAHAPLYEIFNYFSWKLELEEKCELKFETLQKEDG